MKWYNLKKYQPWATGIELIVRNNYGIFIAQLEDYGVWMDSDGKYFEDDAKPTHFAIPDPIEIEE